MFESIRRRRPWLLMVACLLLAGCGGNALGRLPVRILIVMLTRKGKGSQ